VGGRYIQGGRVVGEKGMMYERSEGETREGGEVGMK